MPRILNAVKPLLDRGTSILSIVPGPAGALAVPEVAGYESRVHLPTPARKASARQGRTPAPLGTEDAGGSGSTPPAEEGQRQSAVAKVTASKDAS